MSRKMRNSKTEAKIFKPTLSNCRSGAGPSALTPEDGPSTSMRIRDLKVSNVPISTLKPYAGNPRTHSKQQIRQIAASIKAFGWTNPILIDGEAVVIAGHGRLRAAMSLGIDRVPTICINDMTEAQKRAYVLADNKLAENAGWDRELLALELQGLLEMDLDFDVTATGFEMGEIDVLIGSSDEEDDEADHLPEVDTAALPVTRPGDLWQLSRHRLLCADATQPASFETLMDGERAEMVFTDPALQCADRRACFRLRVFEAFRVRHGFGRDERG